MLLLRDDDPFFLDSHFFSLHVTCLLLPFARLPSFPPSPPAAPSPLGLHLLFIYSNHAHVERTATVGLQAKTALAMPVCPPETRTFSF